MTNNLARGVDVDESTQTKTCTRCGVTLPLDAFSKRSRSADGLQPKCKPCEAARKRELRAMTDDEKSSARAALILPEKACNTCGEVKPLAEFPPRASMRDGRRSRCRKCQNAATRGRYSDRIYSAEEIATFLATGPADKACTSCGHMKPLNDFPVDRYKRDGRATACRSCRNESSKTWREANSDRVLANSKAWREANREKAAALSRAWQAANPDRVKAWRTAYLISNASKVAASRRAWYDRNRQHSREWQLANPERAREIAKRSRQRNPERSRRARHNRRARMRAAAIGPIDFDALWTGSCGICGLPMGRELRWPDPMSKSIDHIIPLSKGGSHTQENLAWTHLGCNVRKGARIEPLVVAVEPEG